MITFSYFEYNNNIITYIIRKPSERRRAQIYVWLLVLTCYNCTYYCGPRYLPRLQPYARTVIIAYNKIKFLIPRTDASGDAVHLDDILVFGNCCFFFFIYYI
jgi:hypothetical protein